MTEITPSPRTRVNASAGHLEVRIEGAHPAECSFQFERQQERIGPAAIASMVYHGLMIAGIVLLIRYGSYQAPTKTVEPEVDYSKIVWLNEPGPGGGGGGGGNRMKAPPKKAELKGEDQTTVPVQKPPELEMKIEDLIQQLNIPAKTLADAQASLPGAIEGLPSLSLGSGTGGGAGTGSGTGIGPGTGSGLGPGSGGGTGGGVYRPGNGVSMPRLLVAPKPQYTSDAMRAKVQGIVTLEFVILPDGSVGDVKVIRSLDRNFGLDQEAIKALKKCRFEPGRLRGEPVAVLATYEMEFTLR